MSQHLIWGKDGHMGGHPGMAPCMCPTHLARASPCLLSSTFRSERKIPPSTVTCCFSLSTCKGWDGRGEGHRAWRRKTPWKTPLLLPMLLIMSIQESHPPQRPCPILSCRLSQTFTQPKPHPTQWCHWVLSLVQPLLPSALPSLRGV